MRNTLFDTIRCRVPQLDPGQPGRFFAADHRRATQGEVLRHTILRDPVFRPRLAVHRKGHDIELA